MVVVAMVTVAVVVVVMALRWVAAGSNVAEALASGVLAAVGVIVVLRFAWSVSYSVDMSSGMTVDLFTDTLAAVMLAIAVLPDMDPNTMTALEFPVSTPLEE